MRKILCITIMIMLISFVLTGSAIGATTYQNYQVQGNTLEEVENSMKTQGPVGSDGRHYPGLATINVTKTVQAGLPKVDPILPEPWWRATITATVTWGISAKIELPQWPGAAQAGPNVQAEWTRYTAALKAHEDGHVKTAEDTLKNMQPPPKTSFSASGDGLSPGEALANAQASLDQQIAQEQQRIEAAIDKAEKEYDTQTQNGVTQGAVLDTHVSDNIPPDRIRDLIAGIGITEAEGGVAESLEKMLQNALAAVLKGNNRAAVGKLNAFINHVGAQAGKQNGPTNDEAEYMAREAISIRNALRG